MNIRQTIFVAAEEMFLAMLVGMVCGMVASLIVGKSFALMVMSRVRS